MFSVILVTLLGAFAYITIHRTEQSILPLSKKVSDRLGQLWNAANQGIRQHKYLRAERALLTILRFDKKNSAAYSRLGVIYARQKEYKDSIECFEIASSIDPCASSLHNLGLIYYETENYEKAALAFENALEIEDDLAARYIAYAKVQEKLNHPKIVVEALENAVRLEKNKQTINLLIYAYDANDQTEEAAKLRSRLARLVIPEGTPKRAQQPRRVIM